LLEEINLVGRLFTWSSEQERPTLELLDRMFATAEWLTAFPNHLLRPLSSDCSDHYPLLL
jgi:endonuclease/exonuclease/phosphatase family metal-dependent hydrolase